MARPSRCGMGVFVNSAATSDGEVEIGRQTMKLLIVTVIPALALAAVAARSGSLAVPRLLLMTLIAAAALLPAAAAAEPLPGTEPLGEQGDLAAKMVAGIDRFLSRETGEV